MTFNGRVDFPNLRALMRTRGIHLYHLGQLLRMSDSAMNQRLLGRIPLAPHEKRRLAELFGVEEAWLFAPLVVPPAVRRETAMLTPAMETR
jgi:transcriptional regulator with XRE-family HTH domain